MSAQTNTPPPTAVSPVTAVPDHIGQYFKELAETYNREWLALQHAPAGRLREAPLPPSSVETILDTMKEMKLESTGWPRFNFVPLTHRQPLDKMMADFLSHPDLQLVHAIRFLILMGGLVYYPDRASFVITMDFSKYLSLYRTHRKLSFGLTEINAVLTASGLTTTLVGYSCLMQMGDALPFDWEPGSVWPFYMAHTSILEEILTKRRLSIPLPRREKDNIQRKAFLVMSRFPTIPDNCLAWLLDIAVGKAKTNGARARAVLENRSGVSDWAGERLYSKRAHERAAAGQWLEEIKQKQAGAGHDHDENTPGENGGHELIDFKGYMLDNRELYRLITVAGYVIGPQEDERMAFRYVKTYTQYDILAIIEFSGSQSPHQQKEVALVAAYFKPIKKKDLLEITPPPTKLPINRVPVEPLNETRILLNRLADAGTGYHNDWRKKI